MSGMNDTSGSRGTQISNGEVGLHQIRICIVDDHPAVLVGLRSMLSSDDHFLVVGTFSNASALLDAPADLSPMVVLLDLRMPGLRGSQCIEPIRERWPSTRFLIISSFDMAEEIFHALDAGALGFVRKSASPEEIDHAVRKVCAGKRYLPSDIAHRSRDWEKREQLTTRELEILRRVVHGDTSKEIGVELQISEFTVRNHVNNVLAKLRARDRTEAAVLALRRGLIALEDLER